jgi:D-2-hydroxyacid dehydrogenase (NADP+)
LTSVIIENPNASRYAAALARDFPEVRFYEMPTPEDLIRHLPALRGAEVLMTLGGSMRPDIVAGLPALAWVQSLIAGVDRFVNVLARRPSVLLTSTRGMHGEQMAEMALTQMLVLARNVPWFVHNQQRHVWQRREPSLLRGKCVGIVGLGTSGREIARVCKTLGMHVIGISRRHDGSHPCDEAYGYDGIAEAAAKADFLVLAASYRPDTQRLIDAGVLAAMKPTAFLINIARGGVVDEDALVAALRDGRIAGAALDVTQVEPVPATSPLWDLPNLFLTPHVAGMSDHYVEQALRIIGPNLKAYLSGDIADLLNRVEIPLAHAESGCAKHQNPYR